MKEGSAMTEILAIDDDREILAVIKKCTFAGRVSGDGT